MTMKRYRREIYSYNQNGPMKVRVSEKSSHCFFPVWSAHRWNASPPAVNLKPNYYPGNTEDLPPQMEKPVTRMNMNPTIARWGRVSHFRSRRKPIVSPPTYGKRSTTKPSLLMQVYHLGYPVHRAVERTRAKCKGISWC